MSKEEPNFGLHSLVILPSCASLQSSLIQETVSPHLHPDHLLETQKNTGTLSEGCFHGKRVKRSHVVTNAKIIVSDILMALKDLLRFFLFVCKEFHFRFIFCWLLFLSSHFYFTHKFGAYFFLSQFKCMKVVVKLF